MLWPFDRLTASWPILCPAFNMDLYHVYCGFYYSLRPKNFCGLSLSNNKLPWVVRSWPFDHSLTDFWPIFYFLPVILPFLNCQPPNFKTAKDQPYFLCSLLLWSETLKNINLRRQPLFYRRNHRKWRFPLFAVFRR